MKKYLSVDCDYWYDADQAERQLILLMQKLRAGVPVIAVMNHQQMLPEVNASGALQLINIDEHSDLSEKTVGSFDCGTWVSYVKWRQQGTYIWVRPDKSYQGSCNGDDRATWNALTDWKYSDSRYIARKNLRITNYLQDCVGVGLCMSPAYACSDVIRVFRHIVKHYDIPYRKGLRKENNHRRLRPSGIPLSI